MQVSAGMETPNGSPQHGPDAVVSGADGRADGAERSRRARARWVLGGFAAGIVVAFLIIAARVAMVGWRILPYELVFDLIWSPILGAEMGVGLGKWRHPAPREQRRFWRRPRFRMLTLMILVAYVALLFGMGVSTAPLGEAARRYDQKYQTSVALLEQLRIQARTMETESRQRQAAAAELRSERIPEVLLPPSRKESLEFLVQIAKPQDRKDGFDRIADDESLHVRRLEQAAWVLRRLIADCEELAAKYDRARWRPWLPVEPDPPRPSTQ